MIRLPGLKFPNLFMVLLDVLRFYEEQEFQLQVRLRQRHAWFTKQKSQLSLNYEDVDDPDLRNVHAPSHIAHIMSNTPDYLKDLFEEFFNFVTETGLTCYATTGEYIFRVSNK